MRRLALLALLICLLLQPALAQTPAPAASASPSSVPQATATPVAPEFATAAASLRAFLLLMQEGSPLKPKPWNQARAHLDLSAVPTVVREERGVLLSHQLYKILEAAPLDLDNLRVEAGETQAVVYRQPSGHAIAMQKQLDGRWLISADTVAAIPDMFGVLEDKGRIQVRHIAALDFHFLGLSGEQWLGLLLLPVISYLLGLLFALILKLLTGRLVGRLRLRESIHRSSALKPLGWVVTTFAFWAGLPGLALPNALLVVLTVLVKVAASLALVITAFRFTDALSDYASTFSARSATRFDDMLIPLARRSMKVLLAVLGILFLAQNLSIEVWSLFAGFSIFGAMVALAGQDMVKNIFGSLTIFLDKPFRVGDFIKVEGIEGFIEDVGFRSTRMRSLKGSTITLPNSRLITAAVDNLGAEAFTPYKQYSKRLHLPWSTPPERLEAFCEGVRELVRRHPYTRKDLFEVWLNDLSEDALELLIEVMWTVPDASTELRERHRFLVDLHRLAGQLEIRFASPLQRMLVETEPGQQETENQEEDAASDFSPALQKKAALRGQAASEALLLVSLPQGTPAPAKPGEGMAAL
jgi:MscS family membrane protein